MTPGQGRYPRVLPLSSPTFLGKKDGMMDSFTVVLSFESAPSDLAAKRQDSGLVTVFGHLAQVLCRLGKGHPLHAVMGHLVLGQGQHVSGRASSARDQDCASAQSQAHPESQGQGIMLLLPPQCPHPAPRTPH